MIWLSSKKNRNIYVNKWYYTTKKICDGKSKFINKYHNFTDDWYKKYICLVNSRLDSCRPVSSILEIVSLGKM